MGIRRRRLFFFFLGGVVRVYAQQIKGENPSCTVQPPQRRNDETKRQREKSKRKPIIRTAVACRPPTRPTDRFMLSPWPRLYTLSKQQTRPCHRRRRRSSPVDRQSAAVENTMERKTRHERKKERKKKRLRKTPSLTDQKIHPVRPVPVMLHVP
ncbi:uncharacterized protein IWZ02DRAFT_193726 [Phyllosticta citriasiana]|uniref:uncharacterized protein n=1 Tax=Phyllosticta citriasiana TaxID=595635 RepID=UPI0030FD8B8B